MSKYIGYLVVSRRTGYMLEGKDHTARIFDSEAIARRACKPFQEQTPVPIPYHHVARSLLDGSAFCFETEEGYAKFMKCLRNDTSNKPFMAYSQDRNCIRWRHTAKTTPKPEASAPVQNVPGPEVYNPAILARGP
jgi:hypothetical protein